MHKETRETFALDQVYHSQMDNIEIFDSHIKGMVAQAFEGHNMTVFTYGQTSSGKTFTMRGTWDQKGIIPLTLQEIFIRIQDHILASEEAKFKI